MKFKEDYYEDVLERIFIRIQIESKWRNISLKGALKYQDRLKEWLKEFSEGYFIDATPSIPITESELIEIIKWLDGIKPPVRLKHKNERL